MTRPARSECLHLLQEWQRTTEALKAQHQVLRNVLTVAPECPLVEAGHAVVSAHTAVLARIVEDKAGWLEWFHLENDFGRKGFEASAQDNWRPIRTLEDLLTLILEVAE